MKADSCLSSCITWNKETRGSLRAVYLAVACALYYSSVFHSLCFEIQTPAPELNFCQGEPRKRLSSLSRTLADAAMGMAPSHRSLQGPSTFGASPLYHSRDY